MTKTDKDNNDFNDLCLMAASNNNTTAFNRIIYPKNDLMNRTLIFVFLTGISLGFILGIVIN
jgi:hypothetical protein